MGKPHTERLEHIVAEAITALQAAGASVQCIATGAAALLVGMGEISFVLVVRADVELSQTQLNWTSRWRGGFCVVANATQAVAAARRIASSTQIVKPERLSASYWPKPSNGQEKTAARVAFFRTK